VNAGIFRRAVFFAAADFLVALVGLRAGIEMASLDFDASIIDDRIESRRMASRDRVTHRAVAEFCLNKPSRSLAVRFVVSSSAKLWTMVGMIGVVGIAAACATTDSVGPGPNPSPLAGLVAGATNDSNPVTSPPPQPTPGSFHGTVMGHSTLPPGTDTLSQLPRIAGARLTAYSHVPPTDSDTLGVGSEVASVTTDANGQFQFPTLPGALYIVTIAPPAGSKYQGVWVAAIAHAHSADYAWWVVLPLK